MTREEKVTVVLATLGCLVGLATCYRRPGGRVALWFLAFLVVVIMTILFAAGVQLGKGARPWRPRMLLALLAPIVVVASLRAGAYVAALDFKYRRKKQYEAFIATIKTPPETSEDAWPRAARRHGISCDHGTSGQPVIDR